MALNRTTILLTLALIGMVGHIYRSGQMNVDWVYDVASRLTGSGSGSSSSSNSERPLMFVPEKLDEFYDLVQCDALCAQPASQFSGEYAQMLQDPSCTHRCECRLRCMITNPKPDNDGVAVNIDNVDLIKWRIDPLQLMVGSCVTKC